MHAWVTPKEGGRHQNGCHCPRVGCSVRCRGQLALVPPSCVCTTHTRGQEGARSAEMCPVGGTGNVLHVSKSGKAHPPRPDSHAYPLHTWGGRSTPGASDRVSVPCEKVHLLHVFGRQKEQVFGVEKLPLGGPSAGTGHCNRERRPASPTETRQRSLTCALGPLSISRWSRVRRSVATMSVTGHVGVPCTTLHVPRVK